MPQTPTPEVLLAEVEKNKTAATVENQRADQQTKRASLLLEDDRERDRAALDAWTKAWVAGAQYGTPVPSLDEFKAAMKNDAPTVTLLADLPPPTSDAPPAIGAPKPQPPKGPQPPMMGQPPGGPRAPMVPPQAPQRPPGQPAVSPVAAQAIQSALAGRGLPTSYGQLAARASGLPLFGPGGPPLPQPGGQGSAAG